MKFGPIAHFVTCMGLTALLFFAAYKQSPLFVPLAVVNLLLCGAWKWRFNPR